MFDSPGIHVYMYSKGRHKYQFKHQICDKQNIPGDYDSFDKITTVTV